MKAFRVIFLFVLLTLLCQVPLSTAEKISISADIFGPDIPDSSRELESPSVSPPSSATPSSSPNESPSVSPSSSASPSSSPYTSPSASSAPSATPSSSPTGPELVETTEKLLKYFPGIYEYIDVLQVSQGNGVPSSNCLSKLSIGNLKQLDVFKDIMVLLPHDQISLWPQSELETEEKCRLVETGNSGASSANRGLLFVKFQPRPTNAAPTVRKLNRRATTLLADNPQFPLWLRRIINAKQTMKSLFESVESQLSGKQESRDDNLEDDAQFELSVNEDDTRWTSFFVQNTFSCLIGSKENPQRINLPAYQIRLIDSRSSFQKLKKSFEARKASFDNQIGSIVQQQPPLTREESSDAETEADLIDNLGYYFMLTKANDQTCLYVLSKAAKYIRDMLTIEMNAPGESNPGMTGMSDISIVVTPPCPCDDGFPQRVVLTIPGESSLSPGNPSRFSIVASTVEKEGQNDEINTDPSTNRQAKSNDMRINLAALGDCKLQNATKISSLERDIRLNADMAFLSTENSMTVRAVLLKYFQQATGDTSVTVMQLLNSEDKLKTALHEMRIYGQTSVLIVVKEGSTCGDFEVKQRTAVLFENQHIVQQMKNSTFMAALKQNERADLNTVVSLDNSAKNGNHQKYTAHVFMEGTSGSGMDGESDDEDDDEEFTGMHGGKHRPFGTCVYSASDRTRLYIENYCALFQPLGMYVKKALFETPPPEESGEAKRNRPRPGKDDDRQEETTPTAEMSQGPTDSNSATGGQDQDSNGASSSPSVDPSGDGEEGSDETPAVVNDGGGGEEDGEDMSRGVCFPAAALVTLGDGRRVRMDDVAIGDMVVSRNGSEARVIGMSHADAGAVAEFVVLHTGGGGRIALTGSHYIQSGDRLVKAGAVQVGDMLELADGTATQVVRKRRKRMDGLFSPVTDSGYVAVAFADGEEGEAVGVVASCFTTAVAPDVATALASPLRWAARMGGVTVPGLTEWLRHGSRFWTSWLPKGSTAIRAPGVSYGTRRVRCSGSRESL